MGNDNVWKIRGKRTRRRNGKEGDREREGKRQRDRQTERKERKIDSNISLHLLKRQAEFNK